MKNKETTYEVYKIVNKINSKLYVGITTQGFKTRWYKHCSDAIQDSTFPIHAAIRKYGQDNFEINILESCSDIQSLKDREIYWIKELNSKTKGNGYNLTEGGDGTFGRKQTEETKDKIRQKALGRKATENVLHNMRVSSNLSKKISQFTLGGKYIKTYYSVSEAGRQLGKIPSVISACAREDNKTAYGFRWSYTDKLPEDPISEIKVLKKERLPFKHTEESIRKIKESNIKRWEENPQRRVNARLNNPKNHAILQYTLDNKFVKEFRSVAEAKEEMGVSTHTNIAKCARGQRKQASGFIWKYKDGYNTPMQDPDKNTYGELLFGES